MTSSSAKIIGFVVEVAGTQLNYQLQIIISTLIPELASSLETDSRVHEDIKLCASNIMASISTSGVNYLIDELKDHIQDEENPISRSSILF
jgi:hypothetical protein